MNFDQNSKGYYLVCKLNGLMCWISERWWDIVKCGYDDNNCNSEDFLLINPNISSLLYL